MSKRDDVEEFAALLRQLKSRTDRSYGSLARRINMNTSTLHRYCKGDAVPQDFAPVERLAAFCQATPQERLELHRLWMSLVEARQQTRAGAPVEASAAKPAAAPEPSPDEGREPAAESCAGAQAGLGSDSATPAAHLARGAWYRRRRVLVPAAITCALLATWGGTSLPSGDPSSGASLPRSTASAAPHASATPTDRSSPPRSSASPRSRHGTSAPAVTNDSRTRTQKPLTGLPLAWSADSQVWDLGCRHDYVVGKPPAKVPPPPVQQDAGAWAAAQDAVHGQQTMVQISVQGRSSTAVVLEALRVRVVSRGEPSAGYAYATDQGCGSDLTLRRFTADLDADRPIVRSKNGADAGRVIPAAHFPYRVSAADPEVLLVDATTQTSDARWYLELDWSCQGRTGTVRIDDHGRPFHTTGITKMAHFWYGTNDAGTRAWVPYDR
ncbi:helix-turn-helix domain-containing protein [Streptomyces sp. NPDC086783]|uniref:helix-turn-helix domain-containing protein n=1 Tax=Streptomyces sp. NPDC086783 TaxID=3365758 RepID=UPI00382C0C16